MRKIYFLVIALAAFINVSVAQTTYTWVGAATGDYQVSGNWSPARTAPATTDILSFNATAAINLVNVPNQTIGAISIASGTNSVSFATNVSTNVLTLSAATPLIYTTAGTIQAADFLTIRLANTTSFTMSSGTFGIATSTGGKINLNGTLVLSGGKLDFDVAGTGGTTVNGSVTYNSGIFTCATATAITWANGSNYYHAVGGAAASVIPLTTWSTGSTCHITGMNTGTVIPSGLTTNNFYNFRWNCAAQLSDATLLTANETININGTFSVLATGAGSQKLILATTAGGTVKADNYDQSAGTVVLQSSTGTTTLAVATSFSHSGGIIDGVTGSGAGTGIFDFKGNVTKGASATWQCTSTSTGAQVTLQFSGSLTQNVNIGGTSATWVQPAAGRSNIDISNTNQVSGVSLTGTLRVYNRNNAGVATCTLNGIITIAVTGAYISYSSGASSGGTELIYNWGYPQTATSTEFPTSNSPTSLRISNALGVSFPSGFNRTLTGTLSLVNGSLDMQGSTLSLTNTTLANQLVQTSGYIFRGTLGRWFPTSGLPVIGTTISSRFPFGTGVNDRSLNIYFSGATLTAGTAGIIYASHNSAINATPISVTEDITLDKRSNSSWTIDASAFNLGSGGQTISVTALGTNIGSVTNINTLRLTDGVAPYGTLIATTGTTVSPKVGKSNLLISDLTSKTLYFGSDNANALQIITYTWTGVSSTLWTDAGNWTSISSGYPSSSTEIADVSSTLGSMPTIPTATVINLYQLVVGAPVTLTMTGTASLNVVDAVTFNGSASFASSSTFTYSSGVSVTQNVAPLTYGNLIFSGSGTRVLPSTLTVTGNFTNVASAANTVITGNTFIFAGTGAQKISEGYYNNITISGNRGGAQIGLGNLIVANTIDVVGVFSVTATNYTVKYDFNTFRFSSSSSQTIPGFIYSTIANTPAGAPRVLDPLGSADPTHAIVVRSFTPAANITTTGSKIKYYRDATTNFRGNNSFNYYDLEIYGNVNGGTFKFIGPTNVVNKFSFTCTNFTQIANYNSVDVLEPSGFINFKGTVDQTIPACVTGFTYDNIGYSYGSRNVTLESSGSIRVYGDIAPVSSPGVWGAGNGFIVNNSTVNFQVGSSSVPVLQPVTGGNNYHHITVTSGTRQLAGNLIMGGNLTVNGTDPSMGTLKVGDGSTTRTLTILGNLVVSGTSSVPQSTAQLDLNTGSAGTSTVYLAGNLSVAGVGQITTVAGAKNGTLIFNGTNQQYSYTSSYKNGFVNYIVGNGTAATTLTLNNTLDLIRSSNSLLAGTLTVMNNSTLSCGTNNITVGDGSTGAAVFNLNAGSILITANTGGVEGTATSSSTGTILNSALMTKTYSPTASYVLNGATTTPFPVAINNMLNLTIGANVSLNQPITASGTLDLGSSTLTQVANNLQFSGLTSTTGNIYADKNSTLTISGTLGTVGTLRFATGGNITGQFNINRPVTVALGSDLTIDKTPLSGNLITGMTNSILDINGNTLTINGAVTGSGTISGSNTSNLTLGGTAGTLYFTATKQILKDFLLNNNATATLGTPLDITGGAAPNTAGSVTVTGTGLLTTNGNLSLKSNINGTARVGQGSTSGGYISGDVTVERYIESSPKRAWRLLAAPAYGPTIKQAWQENQAATVDPGTGYGTIITSNNSATWASGGFDYLTPGNSLLIYNSGTNAWDGATSTLVPISGAGLNKAYMIFIRGDRTANPNNGPASSPATVRIKGTIFQGNLPSVPVTAPGKWVTVGNNYASAVEFTTLGDANIDETFTVWDPKLPGAYGLGGYVTFSATTSPAWKPVPAGGSFTVDVPNTRIESGQGFMVYSTSGGGNISFKESSKISGSKMVFRPMPNPATKQSLTTNLYSLGADGAAAIADGNVVVFNEAYSNAIDSKDAYKLANFGDNIGILRNGRTLVVEGRQPVVGADTVFFNARRLKQQGYRLEFITANFDPALVGYLEDKFTNTSTTVNMNGKTTYDFTIGSDAVSAAPDRFRIVFKSISVVPVTFSNIKAAEQGKNIAVEWKVENEVNIVKYDIEKSTDGRTFVKIGQVPAKGGNSVYTWADEDPLSGNNFYRVRAYENNDKVLLSKVVNVDISRVAGSSNFTIYPNPIKDGTIGLKMKNVSAGLYSVKLINQLGQVIEKTSINHSGGNGSQAFRLPQNPGEGVYQLEIISPDNKTTVLKMLVLGN
ncbi:MAG: hypothetical protein QM791_01530 [Ferruginibacter sp.]